jgi:hypothetical protein
MMVTCSACDRVIGEERSGDLLLRADYWYPSGPAEWRYGAHRRKRAIGQRTLPPPAEERTRPTPILWGTRWLYQVTAGTVICRCGNAHRHGP